MYNIKYGGFYCIKNPLSIGIIYLRFFRNGKIAYSIRTDINKNENIFDILQNNYSRNIDLVDYHIENGTIDLEINTNIGLLQLSGKINNDSIIFNIMNSTTRTTVADDMIFSYNKKEYKYANDNKKEKNGNFEKNIPGSPQMARSFNGISYRSIAKWGKNV